MQERTGNFDAPHLSAGEVAHLVIGAVRQRDPRQHLIGARAAVVFTDAVQGGMVGQILDHGEIEVERALLEYDADRAQSLARRMSDVVAENPDVAALDGVETRDQREQCTLSSSIEAEQDGEGRWRDGEGDVVERLTPAVAMAHAFDGDGGRIDGRHFLHHAGVRFLRRSPPDLPMGRRMASTAAPCPGLAVLRLAKARRPVGSQAENTSVVVSPTGVKRTGKLHCCEIAIPQGSSPTWIVLMTLRFATSMTETSFDTPLVVRRYFSSGVNAMCQTRWPTRRYFWISCVAPLITAMRLAGPSATNPVLPSRVMLIPTAWMASFRSPGISKAIFFFTSCFTGSMMLTVPPISDETQTSEASRLNSAKRGRASTSTLATIRRVSVSMKCAILLVSDVATRVLPSGLRPMPSGSTPTCTSPSGTRRSKSMIVTVLSFSLAT